MDFRKSKLQAKMTGILIAICNTEWNKKIVILINIDPSYHFQVFKAVMEYKVPH